jgi:hypothetical protein
MKTPEYQSRRTLSSYTQRSKAQQKAMPTAESHANSRKPCQQQKAMPTAESHAIGIHSASSFFSSSLVL